MLILGVKCRPGFFKSFFLPLALDSRKNKSLNMTVSPPRPIGTCNANYSTLMTSTGRTKIAPPSPFISIVATLLAVH